MNKIGVYREMNKNKNERLAIWGAITLVMLAEVIWTYLWQYTDVIRENIEILFNFDVVYYISSVVFAFVLFPVLFMLLQNIIPCWLERKDSKRREAILTVASGFLFWAAFASIFLFEKKQPYVFSAYLPWHNNVKSEYVIVFFCMLLMLMVYYLLTNSVKRSTGKVMKVFWVFMAVWAAWGVYQPNCFNEIYDTVHVNAYFNSVYRVLHLQPFTEIDGGVYGFYGILLAPLAQVFGGDVVACMVALSVLTALSMLCYYYVLDSLVNYIWVKVVTSFVLIMGMVDVISEIRVQRFPHRIIFAGFVLAYIAYLDKRSISKRFTDVIGNVLVILSLVWNFETGLGCLAAWIGYKIVEALQKYSLKEKKLWQFVFLQISIAVIDLLGAFAFVGIYNLLISGEFITFKAFMFPFVGSNMVDALNVELPLIPSAWMSVLFLFIIAVAFVLLNTRICREKTNQRIKILAAVVIVSCIQMLYYVNRSDYVYLYTVVPTAAIIMAYFADYIVSSSAFSKDTFGNGILRAFAVGNMMVLVLLCMGTIVSFQEVDEKKNVNRDMTNVSMLLEDIENDIPDGTIGYGVGIPELYSMLGRDTGYYGMDVAEIRFMSEENKNKICEWLNEVGDIFVNVESIDKWIIPFVEEGALNDFYLKHEIVKTYEMNGQNYIYYKGK